MYYRTSGGQQHQFFVPAVPTTPDLPNRTTSFQGELRGNINSGGSSIAVYAGVEEKDYDNGTITQKGVFGQIQESNVEGGLYFATGKVQNRPDGWGIEQSAVSVKAGTSFQGPIVGLTGFSRKERADNVDLGGRIGVGHNGVRASASLDIGESTSVTFNFNDNIASNFIPGASYIGLTHRSEEGVWGLDKTSGKWFRYSDGNGEETKMGVAIAPFFVAPYVVPPSTTIRQVDMPEIEKHGLLAEQVSARILNSIVRSDATNWNIFKDSLDEYRTKTGKEVNFLTAYVGAVTVLPNGDRYQNEESLAAFVEATGVIPTSRDQAQDVYREWLYQNNSDFLAGLNEEQRVAFDKIAPNVVSQTRLTPPEVLIEQGADTSVRFPQYSRLRLDTDGDFR